MTDASELSQADFKAVRDRVANIIAGEGQFPEADDIVLAERLLDSGAIDVNGLLQKGL